MKYFIPALFTFSMAMANDFANKQCYLIKNQIDRKYCIDKKMELIKVKTKDEVKWYNKHGITKDNKTKRIQKIENQILGIQEEKTILDQELASLEELKKAINEAKIEKKAKPFVQPKDTTSAPKKDVKTEAKTEVKPKKKKSDKKEKKESPANGIQGQLQNVLENIGKKK
jgi:hypothetical protein